MIDTVLYDWIYDNFTIGYDFKYGSAEGSTGKYAVMFKVSDQERPEVLCEKQGEAGRAIFQFSFYDGGSTGDNTNAVEVLEMAEAFKDQFAQLRGVIGTADQYRIDNNVTQGVTLLGGGQQTLEVWGAFFEAEVWWVEI